MDRRPEVAVVEGRQLSPTGENVRFPTLAEQRRNTAAGEIICLAGAAGLVRADAFETSGGFRGDLLACELDDLCIRQRKRGAHIWRMDANMLVCEPARGAFAGWWRRAVTRGFDSAYAASLHGGPPDRIGVAQMARAIIWGGAFPVLILLVAGGAALIAMELAPMLPTTVVFLVAVAAGVALYGVKIFASAIRRGILSPSSWGQAFGAVLGRFGEFSGVLRFWFGGDRPGARAGKVR